MPVQRASQPGAPAVAADADSARTETARVDRKTGARKVDVPAPAVVAPRRPRRLRRQPQPRPARSRADRGPQRRPERAAADDGAGIRFARGGAQAAGAGGSRRRRGQAAPQQTPIWTYVGVGFAFGLVLLGIYQLYGLLAH